jgi:hypothetical protein
MLCRRRREDGIELIGPCVLAVIALCCLSEDHSDRGGPRIRSTLPINIPNSNSTVEYQLILLFVI